MSKRKPFTIEQRDQIIQFLDTAELTQIEKLSGLGLTILLMAKDRKMWLYNSSSRGQRAIFVLARHGDIKDKHEMISGQITYDNGMLKIVFGEGNAQTQLTIGIYFKVDYFLGDVLHGQWYIDIETSNVKYSRILRKEVANGW